MMLTHRRHSPRLSDGWVMLFAEKGNEHYGEHVWILKTHLPDIPQELVDFAMDYYDIDEEEAEELVNPSKIVSSAGAWDDPQFVSDVWQEFEPIGFRTWDGAVVLDPESVNLEYFEDIEDW